MDSLSNIGGLLPLWLLVAPLVWAIAQLMALPRRPRRDAPSQRTPPP